MHVLVVGPGVMGETLGTAIREAFPAAHITFLGKRGGRAAYLAERLGGATALSPEGVTAPVDYVVLCLKPQQASGALPPLQPLLHPDSYVLSVMTGFAMAQIAQLLQVSAIARAMPNTPGRIGAGLTVWTSQALKPPAHAVITTTLSRLGEALYVEEEKYLDMATALSGSGPAYVYLFMEALIDAGVHMGLPRYLAERMVLVTLRGAIAYYEQSGKLVTALRHEVTSPGGTTAEAIYQLEKAGLRPALSRAVWAAYQRALALRPSLQSPFTAQSAQVLPEQL